MSKYLPHFAQTKQALDVMEDEFGYPGMARIMVKDVSLQEAKKIRQQISDLDGVDLVIGPDLTTDVYMGASFVNQGITDMMSVDAFSMEDYYHDGYALMDVIFENGDDSPLTREG